MKYYKRKTDSQWMALVTYRDGKVETIGPTVDRRGIEHWVEYSVYDDDTGKPVHNYKVD